MYVICNQERHAFVDTGMSWSHLKLLIHKSCSNHILGVLNCIVISKESQVSSMYVLLLFSKSLWNWGIHHIRKKYVTMQLKYILGPFSVLIPCSCFCCTSGIWFDWSVIVHVTVALMNSFLIVCYLPIDTCFLIPNRYGVFSACSSTTHVSVI